MTKMSPRKMTMSPKKMSRKRSLGKRSLRRSGHKRSFRRNHVEGGGLGFGLLPYKLVHDPDAEAKRQAAAQKIKDAASAAYKGLKYAGKKAYEGAASLGSSYSDYNTRKGITNYQKEVCEKSLEKVRSDLSGIFGTGMTERQKEIYEKLKAETEALKPCRMTTDKYIQDIESQPINADAYYEPGAFSGKNPMNTEQRRHLQHLQQFQQKIKLLPEGKEERREERREAISPNSNAELARLEALYR